MSSMSAPLSQTIAALAQGVPTVARHGVRKRGHPPVYAPCASMSSMSAPVTDCTRHRLHPSQTIAALAQGVPTVARHGVRKRGC
jgi:hypothetical protein